MSLTHLSGEFLIWAPRQQRFPISIDRRGRCTGDCLLCFETILENSSPPSLWWQITINHPRSDRVGPSESLRFSNFRGASPVPLRSSLSAARASGESDRGVSHALLFFPGRFSACCDSVGCVFRCSPDQAASLSRHQPRSGGVHLCGRSL